MPGSFVTLLIILILLGLVSCAAVVVAMAFSLLRPPRMTDGKATWVLQRISPGDLGLRFEEMHFVVRDERDGRRLRLAGWWIPAAQSAGRCVILLHGYADAKVGAIAWAPIWHKLGFNILAIDLRAHGESEGKYCTAGYWERHDVSQVIDEIRAQKPQETRHVALFGVSMGAAVAAATAAMRTDLAAVVLESPFADFRHAATAQMERLGTPGRPFQQLAVRVAERIAGCDFTSVRPVELTKQISCPLMVIAPDGDLTVIENDRTAIEVSIRARNDKQTSVFCPVKSGHLLALHAEPQHYQDRLSEFVENAMAGVPN